MDEREIRLRCIEAAAKTPTVHSKGHAEGVLETAKAWYEWVLDPKTGLETVL
jgi:hypothetical protein